VSRRRYGLVGTGSRGLDLYARALLTTHADVGALVGMTDANPLRAAAARSLCREGTGVEPPVFGSMEELLAAGEPETVIVTSIDRTHDELVVGALEGGCDVIVEKPMAIDEVGVRRILEAQARTGGEVRVAFNYRYAQYFTAVKGLLAAGVIGDVLSLDFHWYLDQGHGADYFRRWHRRMANSGGLFVHKATHHFDLVDWWLGDRPLGVRASGSLRFYGPVRSERGERCRGCAWFEECAFAWDLAEDEVLRRLYLEAEQADGYHRDGCVFDPSIDIFDTMSATVAYEGGATMTYSLNAYCAYEGMRCAVNGTTGRLEVEQIESRDVPADDLVMYRFGTEEPIETVRVERVDGGHGGGDERMLDDLFRGGVEDPLGHAAGVRDGADSVLTGVAANRSVAAGGRPVSIAELRDGPANGGRAPA
jgi:predicted dehydrogenase